MTGIKRLVIKLNEDPYSRALYLNTPPSKSNFSANVNWIDRYCTTSIGFLFQKLGNPIISIAIVNSSNFSRGRGLVWMAFNNKSYSRTRNYMLDCSTELDCSVVYKNPVTCFVIQFVTPNTLNNYNMVQPN